MDYNTAIHFRMTPQEETNILSNPSTGDVRYGSLGPINQDNFTVYKRRWYILLIFCICSAINAFKWNTWGPIQGTCQVVFGWSNTTITMLVAWNPIVCFVVVLPMSWLMGVKGEKSRNWKHVFFENAVGFFYLSRVFYLYFFIENAVVF